MTESLEVLYARMDERLDRIEASLTKDLASMQGHRRS